MRLLYRSLLAVWMPAAAFAAAASLPAVMAIDPGFGPLFETTDAAVYASVRQSDGKLIVGGQFTTISGVRRHNLARLLPTGAVDLTFDPGAGPSDTVLALALQADGRVLVGGDFGSFAGVTRSKIARVLSNGLLDTTFDPGPGADQNVLAIAVQADGRILIGGSFATFANTKRGRLARLLQSGALDPTYATGAGASGLVQALAIQPDGKALIGGGFVQYDGVVRNGLVRLTAAGSADSTFAVLTSTSVSALALQADGKVIVGSGNLGGSPPNLLRVRADGSSDASFAPGTGPDGPVNALSVDEGGRILVGGLFTSFNGQSLNRIVRLQSSGALDLTFRPPANIDSPVRTLIPLPDSSVMVGGPFRTFNGTTQGAFARLSASGALDSVFAPSFRASGIVDSFARQLDGKLVVAGRFTHVNGVSHFRIARLNADGSLDATFSPEVALVGGVLGAVAVVTSVEVQSDGKVVLGGFFDRVNGVARNRLARLNADGSVDTAFDPGIGPDFGLTTMAIQSDGRILVGGAFTSYAGVARNHIARVTAQGTVDATFRPGTGTAATNGASGWVTTIEPQSDGRILLGGGFATYDNVTRGGVARVMPDGSLDPTFDPGANFYSGVQTLVSSPDGKVYVCGSFYLNNILYTVARLNGNGTLDASYTLTRFELSNAGLAGALLLLPDGDLLAGQGVNNGSYLSVSGLMLFDASGAGIHFAVQGLGDAHISQFALLPDGALLAAGGEFTDGLTRKSGIVRLTLPGAPAITAATLAFSAGTAGATQIEAQGAPASTFRVVEGSLPAWAALNESSGSIFGRPARHDSGSTAFRVEANNGVGFPNAQNYTVSVAQAPTFAIQPQSQSVSLGTSVTLRAAANNVDQPAYQWQLNGIDLSGATRSLSDLENRGLWHRFLEG